MVIHLKDVTTSTTEDGSKRRDSHPNPLNVKTEINSDEDNLRQRIKDNLKYLEKHGVSRELLEFARREYKLLVTDTKLRYFSKLNSSSNQNDGRSYTGRIASEKQIIDAVWRAEKFLSSLEGVHPSFTKSMLFPHVSGGFWLGLPKKFCTDSLPPDDLRLTLEDENGAGYASLYLGHKNGLSGGWRGFAMTHSLEVGDVLVFELIEPAKFKVYIIKAIEEELSAATQKEDINIKTASAKRQKIATEKENVHPVALSGTNIPKVVAAKKAGRQKKLFYIFMATKIPKCTKFTQPT